MIKRIRALYERRKLDSVQKKKILAIQKLMGATLTRPQLYFKALRHRSTVVEKNLAPNESYEQLEFMGDAILDLIVSELIYNRYPSANEGFMTQLRSQMVKGEMLAKMARNINLMDFIELGDRVKNQGVEYTDSVLADAFEALVGAIYQDQGYETCRDFVMKLYRQNVVFEELVSVRDNFKSMLLEAAQAQKMPPPVYRTVRESGPEHDKIFEVEVRVNNNIFGRGTGKNKKKAEQAAAEEALRLLNNR